MRRSLTWIPFVEDYILKIVFVVSTYTHYVFIHLVFVWKKWCWPFEMDIMGVWFKIMECLKWMEWMKWLFWSKILGIDEINGIEMGKWFKASRMDMG